MDGAAGPPTAVPPLVNYSDQRLPAIRAGHRRVRAPATNAGTVGPGLVSWIQIDTSQLGAFLDPHNSVLEFKLKYKNLLTSADKRTHALLSNAGAAAHIDTLRLYVQGNCVSELQNYGAAQEMLCDMNGNGQYIHDPPLRGAAALADCTWRNQFTGTAVAGAVPADYQPAGVITGGTQKFPQSISPYDYLDPGLHDGYLRGYQAQLGRKLGRPRTFDSTLLHQNRFISRASVVGNVGAANRGDSLTYVCSIPLIDSFLGMFATKAFPLLEFAPGSVQLQITWAQQYVPFYGFITQRHNIDVLEDEWVVVGDTPTNAADADLQLITWEISEINFVHKVIVMPAEVAGVIMSRQAQADTTLRVRQLRYYTLPRLTANTDTYNLIVPAKIQSASAMYLTFRTENLNRLDKFSCCRYNPGFKAHTAPLKVQCRIGSEYVPTQAITTGPELFAETIKAINKLSSTAGETLLDDVRFFGSIDGLAATNFEPGYAAANGDDAIVPAATDAAFHALYINRVCTFLIGIDFDAFSGSTDTTRSGMFLGNNTMTVEMTGLDPDENYVTDAWFLHDAELVIRPTGVAILYY